MKVALIGSSGFVGRHLQKELLRRGHDVTAIVRKNGGIAPQQNLIIVTGDAYSSESVTNAVRDHDAVVSAFNPGWNDPELFDNFIRGSEAIVRGVEASGVRRLVVIGGAGSLFVRSEEHTSELQSLMRISYAVFCLNKKIHIQSKIN